MSVTVIAGVQWGDEGKGRIVDLLASEADLVIRCQGGPNAGHTVVNNQGKFVLHGVPSGIFTPGARSIVGTGTVVNPVGMMEEMKGLADRGVDISNLLISERAHVIMPYHRLFEQLDEQNRSSSNRIGSTGQGIGPAYTDKAARCGVRMGDLVDMDVFRRRLSVILSAKNRLLQALYDQSPMTEEEILAEIEPAAQFLRKYIGDTVEPIYEALQADKKIILEGQLGVMRDLDWGAYPFVTSSCPAPAGLAAGAGVPPQYVNKVIGIVKAYTTAVGASPFPTEQLGNEGDWLRERGGEYGATTGRPRRCGWFDAVASAWSVKVGGFTELALTKLDILDGLEKIPICTAYRSGGKLLKSFPVTSAMEGVEPVYEEMPGWSENTSKAKTMDELPAAARAYIDRIEKLVGAPITLVSVGPERESAISRA